MKLLKYTLLIAITLFVSCSKDDDDQQSIIDETEGLTLIKSLSNDSHTIDLYTKTSSLTDGYNLIYLQIKDGNGNYISNASVSWTPVMHMEMMNHSCPYSSVNRVAGTETLYSGYIVFQMPGNSMEYWEITVNYSINGTEYSASDTINVSPSAHKRVVSFVGNDENRYVLALIEPISPDVAINDMVAGIFVSESMMHFPIVNNYKLKIDPRMPGMGNHGSPNNQDLTQSTQDYLYHGKLSLTMTGYWKINLILENENQEVIGGEEVTDTIESSSIFFEIDF